MRQKSVFVTALLVVLSGFIGLQLGAYRASLQSQSESGCPPPAADTLSKPQSENQQPARDLLQPLVVGASLGTGPGDFMLRKYTLVAQQLKHFMKQLRMPAEQPSDAQLPAPIVYMPQEDNLQLHSAPKVVLRVATYNIRNTVEPWRLRKLAIAKLIQATNADVVGLQEIRTHPSESRNQLDELLALLPEYKYHVYHNVQELESGGYEGIGIISKYLLINPEFIPIAPSERSSDRNTRGCIAAMVEIPLAGLCNIFLTHLSFDAGEQCRQLMLLSRLMDERFKSHQALHQILMGDMNTYFDFEWSMDPLTAKDPFVRQFLASADNPCQDAYGETTPLVFPTVPFTDAWEHFQLQRASAAVPDAPAPVSGKSRGLQKLEQWRTHVHGETYPSMLSSGTADGCRPDRVLFRSAPSLDGGGGGGDTATLALFRVSRFGGLPWRFNPLAAVDSSSGGDGGGVFASDHLGVLVSFVV